ncbi:MAG: tandem-95 repeat protein [Hyphomicrobium sp.]|nr:tandem-95 repeat protein [Hyphomicrobium sp.]
MGTIRVEALPVQSYHLGLFGFDHLQLVYQDENSEIDNQDYWFVIEGIQDGPITDATLGASGESSVLSLAVANGASRNELIDMIGTPESRGSRILLTGITAYTTWQSLAKYAGAIDDSQFPYIPISLPFSATPTINSTALISSVLSTIGLDLNILMPFNVRMSPGGRTLLGTGDANDMTLSGNHTTLATGPKDDILHGANAASSIEKFYGGFDDDEIFWSSGLNVMHGGQSDLAYIIDGIDRIDYTGIGHAIIVGNEYAVEHKTPQFIALHAGGTDQFFSIERAEWNRSNDTVVAGKGVFLIERPFEMDMLGSSGTQGDELSMSESNVPLLVNFVAGEMISVQTQVNEGLDAGYWVKSAEWITGSSAGDRIYAGGSLIGVEGGDGGDVIDARLTASFSGLSPLGYDIEMYGDGGDDTIVSGSGRTFANGGEGSDVFVLSAMTSGAGDVEFVIDGADTSDKFYVPYEFFKATRGGYEESELFQLTGGVFKLDDITQTSYFHWGAIDDNQFEGNIDFAGSVEYSFDGIDLWITIYQGQIITEIIDNGPDEPPGPTITFVRDDSETATTIRVTNWTDGVLGLTFPVTYDPLQPIPSGILSDYPGFMEAVDSATSPDKFMAALDPRPNSHLPKELSNTNTTTARLLPPPGTDGTSGDDTIETLSGGPYQISGLAGNDTITGSDGGDYIDGGAGGDVMHGGRGNDVYTVDSVADQVIETDRGGFDQVYASIDYALGAFVEHVTLQGSATSATGNALRNTLAGNSGNNILSAGDGNDTLAGNGGNDTLIGGDGGDGYVWELGDGRDTIIESGSSGADVIVLAGDLTPSDVVFIRNPDSPLDLTLRFADGGGLTIKDHFANGGPVIEGMNFTSGGSWTAAEFAARAADALVTNNTAPISHDDFYIYANGGAASIPIAALLDNDSDADGDALTISQLSNIQGGTAELDGNGNILVTRTGTHDGNVSLDYTVSDGHGGTSHATFDLAMIDNAAPVLVSASINPLNEDQAATGSLTATDSDGDTLIYKVKAGAAPAKGQIALHTDGTFTYTPNANANGADTFTLTVSDGLSTPIEQRFDVVITPINDAPSGIVLSGTAISEFASNGTAIGQLSVADPDTIDTHSYTLVNNAGGRFAIAGTQLTVANGLLLDHEQAASHSVSIKVTDSSGATFTKTLNINITDTNPEAIIGDDLSNSFTGGAQADTFNGMGGNDTLVGGGGIDEMTGGAGDDKMLVDQAGDIVIEGVGEGTNDFVYTTVSYVLAAGQEIEGFTALPVAGSTTVNLTGNEFRQVMRGNNNDNTFSGGGGNDSLYGFGGNDTLESQQGYDHLFGGAGFDNFQFRQSQLSAQSGIDRIYDFTSGDSIKIDTLAVASLTTLASADFVLGTSALDASDLVIYDQSTGAIWFDADGSGTAAKLLFAVLDTKPALTAADIVLF